MKPPRTCPVFRAIVETLCGLRDSNALAEIALEAFATSLAPMAVIVQALRDRDHNPSWARNMAEAYEPHRETYPLLRELRAVLVASRSSTPASASMPAIDDMIIRHGLTEQEAECRRSRKN